mgnify:CR=1 FL=1
MKFFLDTANLDEIREIAGWGILDGVTTNPSLCAKEKMKFDELIREICRIHAPAVTMMRSKGANSGHPRLPSPTR